MVGFRRPGVDLDALSQRDHEELDALELDDLEVDGSVEVADVDPAVPPLHLLLRQSGRHMSVERAEFTGYRHNK